MAAAADHVQAYVAIHIGHRDVRSALFLRAADAAATTAKMEARKMIGNRFIQMIARLSAEKADAEF